MTRRPWLMLREGRQHAAYLPVCDIHDHDATPLTITAVMPGPDVHVHKYDATTSYNDPGKATLGSVVQMNACDPLTLES